MEDKEIVKAIQERLSEYRKDCELYQTVILEERKLWRNAIESIEAELIASGHKRTLEIVTKHTKELMQ